MLPRSTPSPDKCLKSIEIPSKERRGIESAIDISQGMLWLTVGFEAKEMSARMIQGSDSRETWSNTLKRQRSLRESELETTIHKRRSPTISSSYDRGKLALHAIKKNQLTIRANSKVQPTIRSYSSSTSTATSNRRLIAITSWVVGRLEVDCFCRVLPGNHRAALRRAHHHSTSIKQFLYGGGGGVRWG